MKAETADIRNYDFLMTSTGTDVKNKTKANVTYTGVERQQLEKRGLVMRYQQAFTLDLN